MIRLAMAFQRDMSECNDTHVDIGGEAIVDNADAQLLARSSRRIAGRAGGRKAAIVGVGGWSKIP